MHFGRLPGRVRTAVILSPSQNVPERQAGRGRGGSSPRTCTPLPRVVAHRHSLSLSLSETVPQGLFSAGSSTAKPMLAVWLQQPGFLPLHTTLRQSPCCCFSIPCLHHTAGATWSGYTVTCSRTSKAWPTGGFQVTYAVGAMTEAQTACSSLLSASTQVSVQLKPTIVLSRISPPKDPEAPPAKSPCASESNITLSYSVSSDVRPVNLTVASPTLGVSCTGSPLNFTGGHPYFILGSRT